MKRFLVTLTLAAALAVPATSSASAFTFFGENLGLGEFVRLGAHPNADAARAGFFANLIGVGTENFEGFDEFTGSPLAVLFTGNGVTATLTSTDAFVANVPADTNGVGRYPVSGDQYWDSESPMTITFSSAVAAFGFYGIDIGDFGGQVTLTTNGGVAHVLNVGNTINGLGGGVLYFGFYVTTAAELFTSITFGNTAPGVDFFGFDDFSVGSLEQVNPNPTVPEPGTMLLLASGLVAAAAARRRAKRA